VRCQSSRAPARGRRARLKKSWSPLYGDLDVERLAPELADVFVVLSALASEYEIELTSAIQSKFFEADAHCRWPRADRP
jgi:hypothetical protein